MKKIIEWFINLYAIWIILAFVVGYLYPGAFMWFTKGSWMTLALAVVMLSMGLTLRVEDFKALFATPRVVLSCHFLAGLLQWRWDCLRNLL